MNYVLSDHVLLRAKDRGIPLSAIEDVLVNPIEIIDDESGEPGQKVYQAVTKFSEKGRYLIRVFVNTDKQPFVVKSVYKTSKISKYYEGEI